MGLYDLDSVSITDLNNALTEASIETQDTEISYYICDWKKWHGYYRHVPGLQAVIDKIAEWACGRGVKAKEESKQKILDNLRGCGKDTIQSISRNIIRVSKIGGDGVAEIVRNKRGELVNLKPLSPGSIGVVANNKGIIIAFIQVEQKAGADGIIKPTITNTWKPEQIFYLPWNRIADEIHGISTIEKLEPTIKRIEWAEKTQEILVQRNGKPIVIIEADTDDETKVASLKTKYHNLIENGEAMVVPLGTVKLMDFAAKPGIDILAWLDYLQKKFIIAEGVPEVILGSINSKDTEGAAKILAFGYEQVVKTTQLYFEEQWKAQIGFEIDLPEPPSINPIVAVDTRKSGAMDMKKGGNNMNDLDPKGENK